MGPTRRMALTQRRPAGQRRRGRRDPRAMSGLLLRGRRGARGCKHPGASRRHGASGDGKAVEGAAFNAIVRRLRRARVKPGVCARTRGADHDERLIGRPVALPQQFGR
ncbi:MAG TPA: hypothetical protein VFQ20_01165 [Burkholderiaceae bacterium]|nr:hypothetical protein [Burkholderiaceae bacterium]